MSGLVGDLKGLGFAGMAESGRGDAPATPALAPLEQGSAVARSLYHLIAGDRVVMVKSPPGGGKTTLIATVVAHLHAEYGERVTVAANTHNQVAALAIKIAQQVGNHRVLVLPTTRKRHKRALESIHVDNNEEIAAEVMTLASLDYQAHNTMPEARLLVMDEAYQAQRVQAMSAASGFGQLLLVGDPGQIGPVITGRTTPWRRARFGPHTPFGAFMEHDEEATILNIDKSYRLGAQTVDVLAPMYGFEFTSGRPDRALVVSGVQQPEIGHQVLVNSSVDMSAAQVAAHARSLLGQTIVDNGQARTVTAADVAIVAPLNVQINALSARLSSDPATEDITVGTADKLQGGEWPVVLAIDPLAGGGASNHHLSIGRLCVMLSRHSVAMTFFHDGRWSQTLRDADLTGEDRRLHQSIRTKITSH